MGSLAVANENTIEEHVRTAKMNLDFFLEDVCKEKSKYLLAFAMASLQHAEYMIDE